MTKTQSIQSASLKLFSSLVEMHKLASAKPEDVVELKARYLVQGILLTDEACVEYLNSNIPEQRDIILGLTEYATFNFNDTMRAALLQNFLVAENIPKEHLLYIQLAEYISSYHPDNGWIYDPREYRITSPKGQQAVLRKIDILTMDEVKKRVVDFVANSAMGLTQNTLNALATLIKELEIEVDVSKIPNKELRCKLYLLGEIIPDKPLDLLRLLVFIRTGSTMLIKNRSLIDAITSHAISSEDYFLKGFVEKHGVEPLAESFLRNKVYWTALRRTADDDFKYIVNRIRRAAKHHHKPVKPLPLDNVCNAEITSEYIHELSDAIKNVSIYKLISAYNSLTNHRIISPKVYHIRNGKGFVKDFDNFPDAKDPDRISRVIIQEMIFKEITNRIAVNLEMKYGKREIKFCLPKNIQYAAPTSEKSFLGAIPYGTRFKFDSSRDPVVGIHWYNHNTDGTGRIDLDLHLSSVNFHIGWNTYADERDSGYPAFYSGDITNADPKYGGGTEAFLIKEQPSLDKNRYFLLKVNSFFNAIPSKRPKYQIFVSSLPSNVKPIQKTLVDAKDIAFASINAEFGEKNEESIGFIKVGTDGSKEFIVQRISFTNNIVSSANKLANITLDALESKATLLFDEILNNLETYLKIIRVDNPAEADIDLSNPSNLATDTFISIFGK